MNFEGREDSRSEEVVVGPYSPVVVGVAVLDVSDNFYAVEVQDRFQQELTEC